MTQQEAIEIQTPKGKRRIGPGAPVFIIAELSGNHKGEYERAKRIIDAAIAAGVDAIKLQTYTPDTMTIDCKNEEFMVKVNDAWKGQSLYDLYGTAYTPWEWQPKLKEYAESQGVLLFSTPFDETAVDFLEKMNVAMYKIASFEINDIPLLRKIGSTKKPVIMSRGLAGIEDIQLAVTTLRKAGCPDIAVLHCVSSYPATAEQMNLRTIPDIAERFGVIAGLSDHSLGITASLTSVGLGSCIIEKHFTCRRTDGGPDAAFSLEPDEMKALITSVREAERALGKATYVIGDKEKENLVFRRSIYVVKDVKKGEPFTRENIRVIRPGYGMHPKEYEHIIGRKASKDIERGTAIAKEHVLELP